MTAKKNIFRKTCLVYNFAQHYRLGIFKMLDKHSCNFYFGNKMDDVKKINYRELSNFKKELKNIKIYKSIYWQSGVLSLLNKKYTNFIFLGEYYCISTWIFLIMSKFYNKKVYLWTHGWYGNETKIKKIIKKVFFSFSEGLFLYGDYAKSLMIHEGFNKNKLHVIYNSLDYDMQISVRKKLKETKIFTNFFNNSNPVLIFVGRLKKIKKLDMILSAMSNLKSQGINFNLILIGDGEEKNSLISLSQDLNIQHQIWFYGPAYNEKELGELIYNADLCVSPGNVGLTAMHSLVYGTPVLTNDDFNNQMPEFEAIENDVTGTFFQSGNLKSLELKLTDWIIKNKNRRNKVRKSCFDKIDTKFNPYYQIRIMSKIITDV